MTPSAPMPTARQLVQRALEHSPGGHPHNQQSHAGGMRVFTGVDVTDREKYFATYGEIADEDGVDLGEGVALTARYFKNSDAHIVVDLPGGRSQVVSELSSDAMRQLADDLEELLDYDIGVDQDYPDGIVATIEPDEDEHNVFLALDDAGDIRLRNISDAADDYMDLSGKDARAFVHVLRAVADDYDEQFGGDEADGHVAESASRALEHKPGGVDHDQRSHGRWSAANRARTAARELDELRASIGIAQTRQAQRSRPVPQMAEVSPTATPTRMTKAQYTKRLKDEHVRLQMLDGKTERQAKAAARPAASIDELKERNSALRRQLKAKGVDYRTEEQKREDDAEKNALLDEVERLAVAGGYDGAAKRAGAAKMSPRELRKFVEDVKAFQKRQKAKQAARSQGPTAENAWQAAEDNSRATPRQVGYIMGLLRKRAASGEGGGFMIGPTTSDEVRKMSKGEAGAYINSLTGNY